MAKSNRIASQDPPVYRASRIDPEHTGNRKPAAAALTPDHAEALPSRALLESRRDEIMDDLSRAQSVVQTLRDLLQLVNQDDDAQHAETLDVVDELLSKAHEAIDLILNEATPDELERLAEKSDQAEGEQS